MNHYSLDNSARALAAGLRAEPGTFRDRDSTLHSVDERLLVASQSQGESDSSLEFLSAIRDEDEFQQAKRHSSLVHVLRYVLPAIAFLIILGFAAAMMLRPTGIGEVALDNVGFQDGKLVMDNPKLKGMGADKRGYSMSAAKAYQDVKNPAMVTLQTIAAEVAIGADNIARLTAGGGEYNTQSQELKLLNAIKVKTDDGASITMDNASINLSKGTLKTDAPVTLTSSKASISADRLEVVNKGEKIIFESRVRIRIEPGAFEKGLDANGPTLGASQAVEQTSGAAATVQN